MRSIRNEYLRTARNCLSGATLNGSRGLRSARRKRNGAHSKPMRAAMASARSSAVYSTARHDHWPLAMPSCTTVRMIWRTALLALEDGRLLE